MIESLIEESPVTVASHYDELDAFYREVWGLHVHHGYWSTGKETSLDATIALVDHMLRDVKLDSSSKVVDIGCGYGETSRLLANRYGLNATGLSVSKNQISFAEDIHHPRVDLLHRDWMENNLPDNSFDLAMSIESSEHMPSLKKFFEEAHRVLKPGGTLKVCAWISKDKPKDWEKNFLLQPICTEGRMNLGTVDEYKFLMNAVGFHDVRFEDITQNVKKTWTLCLKRCAWKFMSDPKYISFMMKDPSQNKKFLLSLLRIRAAYETGSMIYGIFSAKR